MTIRLRTFALVVATLAACASTGELDIDAPEPGGTQLPPIDASTPAEGGGVYDGGARDASDARVTPRICSDDDFCHSAVPTGTHFRGVWGDGTGVVWAVTLEQDILRWDGASWKLHYHSHDPITAIWGSGPTDVWVVRDTGLLHGTGESSEQLAFTPTGFIPGDQAAPIRAVWGTGPLDVWAVGGVEPPVGPMRGRVLRYSDDPDLGIGWQLEREPSEHSISFRGICGSPEAGLWLYGVGRSDAGAIEPRVLHRAPGASTWTSISLPEVPTPNYLKDISGGWTTSDGSVWLVGTTATSYTFLFHGTSSDGGATFDWTVRTADLKRPVYGMWGPASDDLWAVGKTGLVAHWDGSKFTQASLRVNDLLVTRSIWAIWGTSSDDFWVVGDEIALHRTREGKP